jgi:hypothetical protein
MGGERGRGCRYCCSWCCSCGCCRCHWCCHHRHSCSHQPHPSFICPRSRLCSSILILAPRLCPHSSVPTPAAGVAAAAGAAATVAPAPASRTPRSSAPALAFVRPTLSLPLAFTLICQSPLSLVSVPLFACLCAPMLCGSSLTVPVCKSKISYHNTLFALTFWYLESTIPEKQKNSQF